MQQAAPAVSVAPPEVPLRALLDRHRTLVEWLQGISSAESTSALHKAWAERSVQRLQGVPVNTVREPSLALLGRAGAGKTSLANTLIGCELLPAKRSTVAMTQTIVDVVVEDLSVKDYHVKIQFTSLELWRVRRAALARERLKALNPDPDEDEDEAVADNGGALLDGLYGDLATNREFLTKFTLPADKQPESPLDPNPEVHRALSDGQRVLQLATLDELRETLRRHVASPTRAEGRDDPGLWLYPIVERVWVRGHFSNSLIPFGIHLLDVPGVDDVSQYRVQIAKSAIESAGTVFLVASCMPTAERPFSSRWVREELGRLSRRGQTTVLVLSGADDVYSAPDCQSMIDEDLREARKHKIDVDIVHCVCNKPRAALDAHPSGYGIQNLRRYISQENAKVLTKLLEVQAHLRSAIMACAADLESGNSISPQSDPAWSAAKERLLAAVREGMHDVRAKQSALVDAISNDRQVICQRTWPDEAKRFLGKELHVATLLATLDRDGGPFASTGKAGLVDLPESFIGWLLSKRPGIATHWRALYEDDLPGAIAALGRAFEKQLGSAPFPVPSSQALTEALTAHVTLRRRDIEGRLVERFRPLLAPVAQAARVDERGQRDRGPGVQGRVVGRFIEALAARSDGMLSDTVAALRELYDQEAVVLAEECGRQVDAAMATLSDSLHGSKRQSALLDQFRAKSGLAPPSGAASVAASASVAAADDLECQVSFDGPVTGRVQGCTCTQPKVCQRCYFKVLSSARDGAKCPFCRAKYDVKVGYRPGDFALRVRGGQP